LEEKDQLDGRQLKVQILGHKLEEEEWFIFLLLILNNQNITTIISFRLMSHLKLMKMKLPTKLNTILNKPDLRKLKNFSKKLSLMKRI